MNLKEISYKSEYYIRGKWGEVTTKLVKGYTYDLGELKIGITNKTPDGKCMKAWAATILPEGLLWRSFRTRKDFEDFLQKDAENIIRIVTQVRKERGQDGK